jgi:hypothetical protein
MGKVIFGDQDYYYDGEPVKSKEEPNKIIDTNGGSTMPELTIVYIAELRFTYELDVIQDRHICDTEQDAQAYLDSWEYSLNEPMQLSIRKVSATLVPIENIPSIN